MKLPTLNLTFHAFMAGTVVCIFLLLSWVIDVRTQDFLHNQQLIASKAAESTALEITTYISNRRKLLRLLQDTYNADFNRIFLSPNEPELKNSIREKIKSIFPEMINFTIAAQSGARIQPKITNFKIGASCQNNIDEFNQGHLETIYIHSNPIPENYHFDIFATLNLANDEKAIIFISVGSSVLESVLKQRSPVNHNLFLVLSSNPESIEVSAQGNKGLLQQNKSLNVLNLEQISSTKKVAMTNWSLVSVFDQQALQTYNHNLKHESLNILIFCFFIALLTSFIYYRTDKKRLEAELITLNSNLVLEETVKDRTKELNYRATHDKLTKLINREEFERRLSEVIAVAKTDNSHFILMYLDLDQFKIINDTAGHAAGDQLLTQISSLLKSQLRRGDTLARLGGDEFGILLHHCDIQRAEIIAETLRSAIHNYGFDWERYSFTIGVSIGIIEIDEKSESINEVLSLVDAACYMAKEHGRNQYYIYNPEDPLFKSKRGAMFYSEMALNAIKNNQIELHAQKICAIASATNPENEYWYEVLVRINQDGQLTFPDQFIPALEQFDHITALDTTVLKLAIKFLAQNPKFKLSINLSALSIVKPEIITTIQQCIDRNKVDPKKICFEITESSAVANLKLVKKFIQSIHHMGCSIALDDFGTGMSSFSYLKNLDVDYIKLDGSFVKDIDVDPIHYTMVDAINEITIAMDKYIIAEYVENKAVFAKLKEIGAAYGQGYEIHKPEKLDDIAST